MTSLYKATSSFVRCLGALVFVGQVSVGSSQLVGPTPYLSIADSPFVGLGLDNFQLEDFEDGQFNLTGVGRSPVGTILGPHVTTDSVDADDGVIDGFGRQGRSLAMAPGSVGFEFWFAGERPTHAGLVWTDGRGLTFFEAWSSANVSMGMMVAAHADDSWAGETQEDRFYGAISLYGISRLRIWTSNQNLGLEVDHIQFGYQRRLIGRLHFGDRSAHPPSVVDIEFKEPNNPATVVHSALNVSADADGNYATADLPPFAGSYLASVKVTPWLRKNVGPINTAVSNSNVNFVLINGDCDGDNEVSIGDYAVLSAAFGSSQGDPTWNPDADLNGDLSVDIGDFAIMSSNFGQVGDL